MKTRIPFVLSLIILIAFQSNAQQLSLNWAQQFGGIGWDYVNDLKPSGNNAFVIGSKTKDINVIA